MTTSSEAIHHPPTKKTFGTCNYDHHRNTDNELRNIRNTRKKLETTEGAE
jgi:hypothetical protein